MEEQTLTLLFHATLLLMDRWIGNPPGNLISYAPTRLNLFNKIHAEKPYLPANLDSSDSLTLSSGLYFSSVSARRLQSP